MRRIRSRSRRLGSRGIATALSVALALVCVVAQLSSAAHLVLVHHERCAEHGEWIHAGDGHAELEADQPALAFETEVSAGQAALEEDHHHCLAVSERREAVLRSECTGGHYRVEADASEVVTEVRTRPVLSVYGFAPKTSPPERV